MLVLTRKRNEEIIFVVPPSSEPTTVRLTVVRIKGGGASATTRLGIEAPPRVRAVRGEIAHELNESPEEAAPQQEE